MISINKALSILGLNRGYSFQELKSNFRKLSFVVHPDRNQGNVECEEELRKLIICYEILEKACTNFGEKTDGNLIIAEKTVEGYRISELGKGYPIIENATTCDICEGKGYTSFREEGAFELVTCPDCEGIGIFSYKCKKCDGSGEYKRNGKVVGECNLCNGSGRFYPENKKPIYPFEPIKYIPGTMKRGYNCKKCKGSGMIYGRALTDRLNHTICQKCEGKGEIRIFNPVLPRGLFAGMSK